MSKENQRVVISKRLLKEGVLRILKKKHVDNITVSELCQESEINRTTFYRHYQTPHDVLLEIELDFVNEFYEASAIQKDVKSMKNFAVRICNFIYENKDTVKLFIQNNTANDLTHIFQNFSDGFLASRKILYKEKTIDSDTLRLMTTFFAYGLYSLVCQWIIEDIPKTPEEIAELILCSLNSDFSFN